MQNLHIWQRLKSMEKALDHKSKAYRILLVGSAFIFSVFMGMILASSWQVKQQRVVTGLVQELKQAEINQMNQLIEQLRQARYPRS